MPFPLFSPHLPFTEIPFSSNALLNRRPCLVLRRVLSQMATVLHSLAEYQLLCHPVSLSILIMSVRYIILGLSALCFSSVLAHCSIQTIHEGGIKWGLKLSHPGRAPFLRYPSRSTSYICEPFPTSITGNYLLGPWRPKYRSSWLTFCCRLKNNTLSGE